MEFPRTPEEFCGQYGFFDKDEVYTNGSLLIPVFRVEQMIEHYFERTCHDTGECRWFCCSECGFGFSDIYVNKEREFGVDVSFPKYCPNCGAKVVDE